MFREIRSLLSEPDLRLAGNVEADETYFAPTRRAGDERPGRRDTSREKAVIGMVERGGRIVAIHVPTATTMEVDAAFTQHVLPGSMVFTDEHRVYGNLGRKGYFHRRIKHSAKVYVSGDIHTQTIEGFWSLVKRGIDGVYHSVSAKHLQAYLNEYAFRYSHRMDERSMFDAMLSRLAETTPAPKPA
jgi:transposase-like protein